jgi:SCY1-like protein 2
MNWGSAATSSNVWANISSPTPLAPPPTSNYPPQASSYNSMSNSMSTLSMNQPRSTSAFSIPPPQQRPGLGVSNSFSLPPPPGGNTYQGSTFAAPQQQSAFGMPPPQQQNTGLGTGQQKKSGLDAWESLL